LKEGIYGDWIWSRVILINGWMDLMLDLWRNMDEKIAISVLKEIGVLYKGDIFEFAS